MAANTVLDGIDKQKWLEPIADALKEAVSGIYQSGGEAGQKIKNALHGTWLGHPLHPVLTDIPIGAWTVALVLDVMDASSPSRSVARGAKIAVGVGLAGAAGAAVTGLTDWQDTDGRARRAGLVHGLLNVTATLLYTASFLKRGGSSRGAARGLAYAGLAVAGAAAWLGGDLVYGEQIGVNHAAGADAPPDFTPVLPETELQEAQLRRVEVNGLRVLLVRKAGRIHAMAETCSHLGGPLAEGKFDGECVQCPWHASRFSVEDGCVVDGPATHPQPCYETRVHNGQIEIRA
ncbi:MAG: Rieske 2Fe-2S domain-containing protein [Acidobacteriota bacterium]|nr:Rieske 2Fe-2S domain-containing protein [Acidobacteriota bacterium]